MSGVINLTSGISVQACLYREQSWKRKAMSPSGAKGKFAFSFGTKRWHLPSKQRPGVLTAHYEILGFPKLRVPFALNIVNFICRHSPGPIDITPYHKGAKETNPDMLMCMLFAVPYVMKFFISDLRVSCLLPASTIQP